jgi:hypothetical protein
MYKGPHPTPESRVPVHVMPREILTAHELLADVAQGLGKVSDKPALIVWATKTRHSRNRSGSAGSRHSLITAP